MFQKKKLVLKNVLRNQRLLLLAAVIVTVPAVAIGLKTLSSPPAVANKKVNAIQTLNNRLLPVVASYDSANDPAKKAALLQQAEKIAKEREQNVVQLIKEDPGSVKQVLLPPSVRSQLPQSVSSHLEEAATISGKMVTVHSDNPKTKEDRYYFYLDSSQGRIALHQPQNDLSLIKNTKANVRITGVKLDGQMAFAGSTSVQTVSTSSTQNVPGAKKAAVLLFNFNNTNGSQAQPITADQARSLVFTGGSSSANGYYQAVTWNKMSLIGKLRSDGDVYGWYTINYSNTTCDPQNWMTAAKAAAQSAGVDLSGYDNIIMMFPYSSSCNWSGMAEVSGTNSWLNGGPQVPTIVHELGHNYGLMHASTESCTNNGQTVTISSTCTYSEYGDPYDPMGFGGFFHFNNYNKGRLGLYMASNTQTITASGTYTVAPEEQPNGVISLRVPVGGNYYYIEDRKNTDQFDFFGSNDPAVNGVFIRIAPDYSQLSHTYLLDATPSSTTDVQALPLGQTFTDSAHGISVKVLSIGSVGATVQVNLAAPPADSTPPTQPTGLSSYTGIGSDVLPYVGLRWTASTDNIGVAAYDIYRNGALVGSTTSTAYIDHGLAYSTAYKYYVVARDAAGNKSQPSITISATTPAVDTQAPSAPTQLSAQSPSQTQVNLSWKASTDNVGIKGYNIYRNGVKIAVAGTTSFGDATVAANTTYSYAVSAFDYSGNVSALSNTVTIRTSSSSTPPPPASTGGIAGSVRDDRSGTPIPGANIQLIRGGGIIQSTSTDSFGSYLFNQLPGDNYQLEVSASHYRHPKKVSVKVVPGSIVIVNVYLR